MQATNEPVRFVVSVDGEPLIKARTTKYKRRWRGKDGKWQYEYETPQQEAAHKAELERKGFKEAQASHAAEITDRYSDAEAMEKLGEIGGDLYAIQATSQTYRGGYERDDVGFSLHDMRAWNNLGAIDSDRERLKRMRLIVAKYKRQLGADEEGKEFVEYVKLGLWDALRAKEEGDPPRLRPETNRHGGVNLPLIGDRLKGKKWDAYRDTMRKYKEHGLRFDGVDRAWYVRKVDLASFPWKQMVADLEFHGIGMEDLPELPEPKEARDEEPTPPPPTDVATTIEAIKRNRISDTVAVTVITEGEHKGKYAFYSTFSRDFNDIFSNKTGVLTGITEYVPELGHARVTNDRHLVDEALARISERMPNHTVVVGPEVREKQGQEQEELKAAQKPIPEVTKHLAQNVELFPFQNAGTRFLLEQDGNALIGDEMGLGKTMQTLAYGAAKGKRMLVVCPRVVRKNWLREATRFFPDYFQGRELKASELRKTGQPDLTQDNIVTVNYESLHKFLPAIEAAGFDTIVIDESHRMKNPKAKITKTLKQLGKDMKHKILLSGTAIKNKKSELFEQIELIRPGMFESAQELKFATTGGVWHKLQSVYMARRKKDVLKDLPPKISSIVRMDVPLDDLPDTPKDIGEISRAKKDLAVAKTGATADFVREMLDSSDSNVLIFSDSKEAAYELKAKLGDVAVLHTGDQTDRQKEAAVAHFDPTTRQQGDSVRVFVATTASAGIGINLQTADKVVFNDLPWTPADLRQAEDRAYRIGTTSSVNVYWNTVEGHEFDELIAETIKRKYELSKKVLEGKQLTPAERKWMDQGISDADMLAILRGEKPKGVPDTKPSESKATQAEPEYQGPTPAPEAETKAAHAEPSEAPKAKPPKMVIRPPALPEKAPTPPPQTYAEKKAEGKRLERVAPTKEEQVAALRDHVSSTVVPQDLRTSMDNFHRMVHEGKEARNPFIQKPRADKLELWYRANVGRTVEGGKVEAVGERSWRWRGGGEEITLTRDVKGGAELSYRLNPPDPPPPGKPPQTPPAAVPTPEEGAQTTVEPKPTPKAEQTAKPAPGAHAGARKPTAATRRRAKLEAAGQLALFKSRRPRFVIRATGFDAAMEHVDRLIKTHELDEAMDLIKAAGHKYLRRIPTGDPKRRWRYIYSEASARAAGGEPAVGEKLKLTSEGQIGHYEVEHVFPNGWVTVRHDESGAFLSLHRDALRDMFKSDHAERVNATHDRLKKTVSAARQFGTEDQQRRAQEQLLAFRQAWQIHAEPEQPKAVIREYPHIERSEMDAKARELAVYDTPTLDGFVEDLRGRMKAAEKSARGVPTHLLRWLAVVSLAKDMRKERQEVATEQQKKEDETPIVAPATTEPEELPTPPPVEGVPKQVTEPTPAPTRERKPRAPTPGKLEATGEHIWGSIKDIRRQNQLTSPDDINEMSYRDAAKLVKRENVVPVPDQNVLRGLGMEPAAAHLALGMLASIKLKPGDTDEERRAYIRDGASVSESILNCRTIRDVEDLGYEILKSMREGPKWVKAGTGTELMESLAHKGKEQHKQFQKFHAIAGTLMKNEPGVEYDVSYCDENGKITSMWAADHVAIFRRVIRPYETLGPRFERFIRRDGKEYRNIKTAARAIEQGTKEGHDGWELLKAAGTMDERKKQEKAAQRVAKKEGKGPYEKGKTLRGWSEALQIQKEAVRTGGTEIPKAADVERTRQTFNLKEIDFGTEGYMRQADREYHTGALEGALHDLSDVIGVPPAMLSFKGRLGIGLGARGTGTAGWKKKAAKAHYEPGKFAMNITKFRGGGSLAHEWAHALDNVLVETNLAKQTGALGGSFATHIPDHTELPAEVKTAVQGVLNAMLKAPDPAKARADHAKRIAFHQENYDRERKKWSSLTAERDEIQMKPESDEQRKQMLERAKNRVERYKEQLAHFEGRKGKKAAEEAMHRKYWLENSMKAVTKLSDPKHVQTEAERRRANEIHEELRMIGPDIDNWYKPLLEIAKKQDPEGSNYSIDANILGADYFAMPTEMLARAFASYVEDKLRGQGRRNTYLVDGTQAKYATLVSLRPETNHAQPFPEGEERKQIHKAIEKLLDVMKTGGHLEKSLRTEPNVRFMLRK